MDIKGKKVGIAMCSSFCVFDKIYDKISALEDMGAEVYTIFSDSVMNIENRFGKGEDFSKKVKDITGREPILSIADAEPIGSEGYLDVLSLCPCTGNTAAKLANGITDSPVLMAAKGHLRNGKPLVIFISTNDGLGMNMKNIGLLMNTKNIYFVPFKQDDAIKKPNSLISDSEKIISALELALDGKQMQPVLI